MDSSCLPALPPPAWAAFRDGEIILQVTGPDAERMVRAVDRRRGLIVDSSCSAALLRVTTRVMELGQRAQAGDLAAMAEVEALDRLLRTPE